MSGLGLGETPGLVDPTLKAVKVTIIAGGGGAATIADGADVTQGAIADAAVTTDAPGTISAKLRGLITLFVNFLSRFPAVLGANGGLKVEGVAGGVAQPVSGPLTDTQLRLTAVPVSLATAPALVAGEAHIGEVGGKGLPITVTPTLTVGAGYVANDFVGTNNTGMTFAGAGRIVAGTGRVIGAILHDYVIASVAAELWLFTVTPAGLGLDSAAFTITDNLTCIGVIPFNTYYASALNSISNGEIKNGQLPYKCGAADTALYGALVTRGAPAYTNGLVSVSIFVDQD